MTAPRLIVYGTGRCGTKSFAAAAATLAWEARCAHEALGDPLLAWQAQYAHGEIPHEQVVHNLKLLAWPDVAVSYMYTGLLPALREAFPDTRFLWLWRHPDEVAASMIRKGWYLPSDDELPPIREWDRKIGGWWLWPQNWRVRGDLTGDVPPDEWAAMTQEQRVWWWIGYVDEHGDPGELFRLPDLSWESLTVLLETAGLEVAWRPGFRVPMVLDDPVYGGRPDTDHP